MNADQGIRSDLSEGNENRLQINNNDKDLQTLQVVMANVPCSSETSVIMVTSSSQGLNFSFSFFQHIIIVLLCQKL